MPPQNEIDSSCTTSLHATTHPDKAHICPLSHEKIVSPVDETHSPDSHTPNPSPSKWLSLQLLNSLQATSYAFIQHQRNTSIKDSEIQNRPSCSQSSRWKGTAIIWTSFAWVLAIIAGCSLHSNNIGAYGLKDVKSSNNCNSINIMKNLTTLGLNILASLLLMASDYIRQCLLSPSRADMDTAHLSKNWFVIGSQSLRNLRSVPNFARILWLALVLTSFPIQVL
jgi:hypothetical protein